MTIPTTAIPMPIRLMYIRLVSSFIAKSRPMQSSAIAIASITSIMVCLSGSGREPKPPPGWIDFQAATIGNPNTFAPFAQFANVFSSV